MKQFILFFLSCIILQDVLAQATSTGTLEGVPIIVNDLHYRLDVNQQEAILDNGNCWEGDLILPSVVHYDGKDYPLTQIGWLAFAFCETITSITIPETVRDVKHYGNLEQYKAPFLGCKNLESIIVDEDNQWLCSVDGVLFNKEKTKLYNYPSGAKRQSYTIPDEVEWIGGSAFQSNQSLKSISIPNTVRQIYESAFQDCKGLEEISLPEGLTTIEQGTFIGCSSLTSIILPNSIKTIETQSFYGCKNLKNLTLPLQLTKIKTLAFSECTSLKVIDFPESISELGGNCLHGCTLDTILIRGHHANSVFEGLLKQINSSATLYVPSTEIDIYTDIYPGTILPLESYDTIHNLPTRQIINSTHTLSGHRLSSPPTRKGVYIRDGKKVVVK